MTAVGVVVGNPKPRSRTLAVAEAVAAAAAGATGLDVSERLVVDLAELANGLFDPTDAAVGAAVAVVPVMVGAGAHHALAVEVHLRPVLLEIGAVMPPRGLYVTEDQLDHLGSAVDRWLVEAGPRLVAAFAGAPPGRDQPAAGNR